MPAHWGPLRRFSGARAARGRRRSRAPPVGLSCSSECYRAVTLPRLLGCAIPLRRCAGLGVLASLPLPESVSFRGDPLTSLDSLSESHSCITAIARSRGIARLLLPRFEPLQRLPVERSHITPADPDPPVTLRPQGFAPSRRFAPRSASPGLFHPGSALGVRTLRGLSPPAAPYVFSHAGPTLGVAP
jgi:hypothetical protein